MFRLQENEETIAEEEEEPRRRNREKKKSDKSQIATEIKVKYERISAYTKVLPIQTIELLSVPPPIFSIGKKPRVIIPKIPEKEDYRSEILPPPILRSDTESRLLIPTPKVIQIEDLGMVRPPSLHLKANIRLLFPLLTECSVDIPPLVRPHPMGYGQTTTPSNRTLRQYMSISVTSTLQPLRILLKSKPQTKDTHETNKTVLGSEMPRAVDLEIFEKLFKSMHGNFSQTITNDKPVIIILSQSDNDNYGTTITILCREIFRELIGGLPNGRIRSKGEKKGIEKNLQAEDRIEYIDDNKIEYVKCKYSNIKTFDEFKECIDWEKLSDRLQELIFQGFGFVIFQVKRDYAERLLEEIERRVGDKKPKIILLSPQIEGQHLDLLRNNSLEGVDLIKVKKKIACALWGFVYPKEDSRWKKGSTFDNFFSACENDFDERLKSIGKSPIKINKEKILPNIIVKDGEDLDFSQPNEESNYHYWMKVFVVKYLIEKMNIPKEKIITEEPLEKNGHIPDIKANNIVIEVETLYGTGRPLNKISNTIRKYLRNPELEVWVVIKNIDVLFYYADMVRLMEDFKKEWSINCRFLTLNFEKRELIDIEEIKKIVDENINPILS